MKNKYKIVIFNKKIYKEIELPEDLDIFKVGTTIDCDYRLHREWFFEEIILHFQNINNQWTLMCGNNVYISTGQSKKLININLIHGIDFVLKYQENNTDIFNMEFEIAFDDKQIEYNREINIIGENIISIGSTKDCQIFLKSQFLENDKILLHRNPKGFLLEPIAITYGVKRNGNKITQDEQIDIGDFISIANFSFYIGQEVILTEASNQCECVNLNYVDCLNRYNYPKFIRNTRVKYVLNDEEIEILDPPSKPKKPKRNILTSLLPSLGMLITAGIMASMGGVRMLIFSGVSVVMAIITMIVNLVQGNKEYKQEVIKREQEYLTYIENKKIEIQEYRKSELENTYCIYKDMKTNEQNFRVFSSDLFDREKKDIDFLHVTIGQGTIEAHRKIKYKKTEKLEVSDELQVLPEKLSEELKYIEEAPIICDFKVSNAIGIVGDEVYRKYLLNDVVYDICSRHFHTDVRFFFIMEFENKHIVNDFRLLPYITNTIGDIRNIVCDEDSRKIVFEFIYNELTRREANKEESYIEYVIFFYDLCGFATHPISKFIEHAAELGITFVFFSETTSRIPQGCNYIIKQKDESSAELIDTANIELNKSFTFYKVSTQIIHDMNYLLAPVEAEEISLEGSLTKNIDIYTLLKIISVEDLDLKTRWGRSRVYESMAVPLGVSKTNTMYLDLHDKAHGPHGLVAGTTGSGKSEILQSYILAVATLFHPYEIGFLIIDFKGGGMVNQFKELPHLLGAITNIDGKEIDRSLKSIKAELQKRQRLFAEAEVNHIDKYIKKYKEGKTRIPLPHLIIIVDEFAELKAEQPEFMKELISAARIGRSLGVHLILATQKPAGQVNEQIWSNSRFKLCLKVQGPEDSNEVLKSPLAAEIKEPGRAYFQVGNNEVFELFQSAYSGAPTQNENSSVKEYSLFQLELSGKRKKIFEQKQENKDSKGKNQLEAIVSHVSEFCKREKIKLLPNICIKALEPQILYEECKEEKFTIGVYDDPDNQYQGPMQIDIDNKNTIIIGSALFGKTNIIRLLIRQIALKKRVNEANIYILDFASLALKCFENMSHVGGVICPTDDEKLKNLFKLLQEELVSRREKMVSVGVSSLADYIEAGYNDLPHIYIFVDNMSAFMELYLQNDDMFLGILREGIAVGISIIITNAQTSGIGYRYLSNFANKVVLYCNDSNEYTNVFQHVGVKPEEIPGRCIVEYDKRLLECQTYLAFEGEKEIERVTAIKQFIEEINTRNIGLHAKHIPYIPTVLSAKQLEDEFGVTTNDYKIPIGLSYNDVTPFILDFSRIGAIGLCGNTIELRINFIKSILNELNKQDVENPVNVTIFDDVNRELKEYQELAIVSSYSIATDSVLELLSDWSDKLQKRYQSMIDEIEEKMELLLLIINNNDVAKKIQEDTKVKNQYMDIITKYKNLNIGIIFTNYENMSIPYDAPEPIRNIKQERHLLYFDNLDNLKVFDIPYEYLKVNKKRLKTDDVYYIRDNSVKKLKLKCTKQLSC